MLIDDLRVELEQLQAAGALREACVCGSRNPPWVEIRGKKVVNFTSWDLLNLNQERSFRRAAHHSIESFGIGASSARLSAGNDLQIVGCESRLAKFFGFESALLFSSRNQAVFSLLTAILNERDVVFFDETTQSPIADACFLIGATAVPVKVNDLERLESNLLKARSFRRALLVIDTLSPTMGEVPLIDQMIALGRRCGVSIILDESYALGGLGLRGSGVLETVSTLPELGQSNRVFGLIADLSMGAASFGAVITGPKILTNILINRSRNLQSEVVLPFPIYSCIESAIDMLELKSLTRVQLLASAARLRAGIREICLQEAAHFNSHIVGVQLKSYRVARDFAQAMLARGVLVDCLPSQAQLQPSAYVRFIVTAAHDEQCISDVLQAVSDVYPKISRI